MTYHWCKTASAIGFAVVVTNIFSACSGEQATVAVARPAATVLGTVTVTPRVAIIAIGDTLQLPVVAATLTGEPLLMSDVDSIRYALNTASDSLYVRLDRTTGAVVGLASTTAPKHVSVNVFAFKDNVARGDQSVVQVTASRVSGPLTMSIQPVSPATTTLTWGQAQAVYPRLRNAVTGDSVVRPAVWYQVSDADVARMGVYEPYIRIPANINPDALQLTARQYPAVALNQVLAYAGEGTTWVHATVLAYGQLLQDSVLYTFVYPSAQTITTAKTNLAVTAAFYQDQVLTLAPGAIVTFTNGVSDEMQVTYTFDQPAEATAVGGGTAGNIAPLGASGSEQRQFLHAGTYKWTATASDPGTPWDGQSVSGTIVIK